MTMLNSTQALSTHTESATKMSTQEMRKRIRQSVEKSRLRMSNLAIDPDATTDNDEYVQKS